MGERLGKKRVLSHSLALAMLVTATDRHEEEQEEDECDLCFHDQGKEREKQQPQVVVADNRGLRCASLQISSGKAKRHQQDSPSVVLQQRHSD